MNGIRMTAAFALAIGWLSVWPAAADEPASRIEAGVVAGMTYNDEDLTSDGTADLELSIGLRGGARFTSRFGGYVDALFSSVGSDIDADTIAARGSLEYLFRSERPERWFVNLGVGLLDVDPEIGEDVDTSIVSVGVGQRIALAGSKHIRWELRGDRSLDDDLGDDVLQGHLLVGVVWGARKDRTVESDADGDGVTDRHDVCPSTPRGLPVDRYGCRLQEVRDADGDGVRDQDDMCPSTPRGLPVDRYGCRVQAGRDTDGDGVHDRDDLCPETTAGWPVDGRGCPRDSDHDRVPDGLDSCPETRSRAIVDARGCPLDTDADGVFDGIDRCPDTPAGRVVDRRGCVAATDTDTDADADMDGVPDRLDACPSTPGGAAVDTRGCVRMAEADADMDGVPDRLDACPSTPGGAAVDTRGCARMAEADADMDGVPDRLDACPDSLRGVAVDAAGCADDTDTDEDGVPDRLDACPDTPRRVAVDRRGCMETAGRDADGDGVPNRFDACPDTPRGAPVDVVGCPEGRRPQAQAGEPLFEDPGDTVVLEGVSFGVDSRQVTPAAMEVLDRVARTLLERPDLKIEIGGHTDSDGSEAYNLRLSSARAAAVRDMLVARGVAPSRLLIRGYGEHWPRADNGTPAGRAKNRRVELKRVD